jgi:hypothetical protein
MLCCDMNLIHDACIGGVRLIPALGSIGLET